jgi:SNF2 family DNA or RNA helicase
MLAFQTRTALMAHQEDAVVKLLPGRVGGLYMDMGTGKSRTLIELARIRSGKIDHVIWFCPVSLKKTVRQEILKHTDCLPEDINVFGEKTCKANLPAALWHIVGIESMASSPRVVLAVNALVTDRTFVAVDESSYIKGHKSLRTRRITQIASRARYRAILTGTPFSQGVVDLFSQMAFLSPKILGYQSFWSFQNAHLVYEQRTNRETGKTFNTDRIIGSHDVAFLADRIAPYVFQVTKEQCLDLPSKIYADRYCSMTEDQQDWHKAAKIEFMAQADEYDFRPIWLFKLFTALQTISCGWWNRTNADGTSTMIDIQNDRLALLSATITDIAPDEKIIIWSKFTKSVDQIIKMIEEEYGPGQAARFDGTLSEEKRAANLARWRGPGCRFLVSTQSSGGHGLTLTESANAIFYSHAFKYSECVQAEDRIHRIGQLRPPTYVSLWSDSKIDERISNALMTKGSALGAFIAEVEKVKATGSKESVRDLVRSL